MKITRPMLEELLALTVPGDDEDEPVELTLRHMEDGPEGAGIYAYYSEYPEEGVTLIDGKSEVLRAEGRASVAGVTAVAPHPDTVLLDFIASEYLDVSAFAMPTGADDADVGWKLHQEHMGAKGRVAVACHYRDDLRAAIREAMRALGHTLPAGVGVVPGETFRPKDADGAPK